MPETRIIYAKSTTIDARGRNGTFKLSGLALRNFPEDREVWLQGVNSKNETSNAARLVVPYDSIPSLIETLEKLK